MNALIRWGKFNLVGAIGMAFQLAILALLDRRAPGHYLYATAAAIELTLLHNFVWHVHFTWRDQRGRFGLIRQLIRFHASNGLVSMVGNLMLMRILAQDAHVPILVANVVAILVCSMINFVLGDRWAFAVGRSFGAADRCSRTPGVP
jgi:putative flippase GtrA